MQYKMVRAILHTKGKDFEWFKQRYEKERQQKNVVLLYEPNEEDAKAMIDIMNAFDGVEVVAAKTRWTREYYHFLGWNDKDKTNHLKMKEVLYLAEQDPMFGGYINNRAKFDKDWAEGTYEDKEEFTPWFDPEDLEILEVICDKKEE